MIALPSYSVDRSVLEHYGARVGPLENRYLYTILRARQPGLRAIYLSSRPVPTEIVEGYLDLVTPGERAVIERQVLLASPDDPSSRSLANKVLDNAPLLDELRRFVGDDPALIEPWNVTEAEQELALALGAPINGTDASLRSVATKSQGRKLFTRVGVPVPAGVEDVASPTDVAAAAKQLRDQVPALAGVVVKLDDSVAGDGNVVLRFDTAEGVDVDDLVRRSLPDWYVDVLQAGGIVEQLVVGEGFCSPSVQVALRPDGVAEIVSTHDQRLGGTHGQVFEGCSFPAREEYALSIASHAQRIAEGLIALGAIGRVGIDFAAVRSSTGWDVYALEINLRKGGTTHPFGLLRVLTGGSYDMEAGTFRLPDGSERCYGATDNLVDDSWRGRAPAEVRQRLRDACVGFDRVQATGVVPHLLDCLPVDGRMGYTAIGRSRDEVAEVEERVEAALRE